MVIASGVSKEFIDAKKNRILAVDRVDFTAHPGEIHGLLGVNGAGKTTLLRVLSTIIRPTGGTASVNGFDVLTNGPEVRRSIGFLSTSTALYGRLTAREMLGYFGSLYGFSGAELKKRVENALERTQATEFANQLCDRLSTGQKQRVSIARTIIHDPPVLFMDEPTAGLDILAAQTVLEFIEAARDQGKTVVFSTHIMSEVERLCDRITVIHQGQVKGFGTLQELKAKTGSSNAEQTFLNLIQPQEEISA